MSGKEETIVVHGKRIQLFTGGSGSPLLYLHGAGTYWWMPVHDRLGTGRRVYLPVHPGFGPGPWEAVDEFLKGNDAFEIDRHRERFLFTFSPNGYLKRVK